MDFTQDLLHDFIIDSTHSHDKYCFHNCTLPCDMDHVTALHCGGCSNRNKFFLHAKCLEIM